MYHYREGFLGLTKRWQARGFGLRPSKNAELLQYVAFADDAVLIAKSVTEIQEMYRDVVRELSKIGLHAHPEKTSISPISPIQTVVIYLEKIDLKRAWLF